MGGGRREPSGLLEMLNTLILLMITRVNICAKRSVCFTLSQFLEIFKNCIHKRGITASSRWESGNLDLNVSVTHHLPAYETLSRSEPSFSLSNYG